MNVEETESDVFISHAHEDKKEVAGPLAKALRKERLKVWYDDYSLRLGDSLEGAIEKGLKTCRFGVVVLSPAFFLKEWPRRELEALLGREAPGGGKVVLPVWHNVTHAEVRSYSPIVAGLKAELTIRGIRVVVRSILKRVASQNPTSASSSLRGRYDPPTSRLFTYGNAISLEQLGRYLTWSTARVESAFLNPRVATLKDYHLTFSTPYGTEAPGRGASNLEHSPEDYVEGVVYELGQGVLTELEERVKGRYWLVPVEIELRDASVLRCQTFIATSPRPGLKPHRKFIDFMVKASEAAGLRPEFIRRLREMDVLDDGF
jgi:hypothetical protein